MHPLLHDLAYALLVLWSLPLVAVAIRAYVTRHEWRRPRPPMTSPMPDSTAPTDCRVTPDATGPDRVTTTHRAGYGDPLQRVESWLRRHPDATLATGEGRVLLAEIDRLRQQLAALRLPGSTP